MNDPSHETQKQPIADLLARYDRPGPRYTSYPTAVEFTPEFTAEQYAMHLERANQESDAPLSLYLHFPFCRERCLFCGCHVIITPHEERARPYLDSLQQEVDLIAERLPNRRSFAQLHLGGGTPTYYSPDELSTVLTHVLERFHPVDGAELAIEVDPRVTTAEHVSTLGDLGFNRVSMGVQDFTPEVQKAIGRQQSVEQTQSIVDAARARGFQGINMDLIYGLPNQTPAAFEQTVHKVIELGVDRAAVYSFAYVPWIRAHQKKLDEKALPDRESKFELFAIARQCFLDAGYVAIGMDHFARPDDELAQARQQGQLKRNFQGYTVLPGDDVIGFGISAIGDVAGAFVQNEKKLSRYAQAVAEGKLPVERGYARSPDDNIRRDVIAELMCNLHVDFATIEQAHGVSFREYFAIDLQQLQPYVDEGLAQLHNSALQVTPTGELFVRNLAMCFDQHWRDKHAGGEAPIFSRTV